jgi:hypothetical protein
VLSIHPPPALLNGVVTTTRGRPLDNDYSADVDSDSSDDESSAGPPPLRPRYDESSDDVSSVGSLPPLVPRSVDGYVDDDDELCSFEDSLEDDDASTDDDASVWYDVMEDKEVQDDVEVEWFANYCELCATIPEEDNVSLLTFVMNWWRGAFFLLWKLIVGGVQELFEPLWKLIGVPSFFLATPWWDTLDIILVPPPHKIRSSITRKHRRHVAAWEYKHLKDQSWSPSLFLCSVTWLIFIHAILLGSDITPP